MQSGAALRNPELSWNDSNTRRRSKRFAVDTPAMLVSVGPPLMHISGVLRNLSADGLLFLTLEQTALQIGARIFVQFSSAMVCGQIRHIHTTGDQTSIGIEICEAQFGQLSRQYGA